MSGLNQYEYANQIKVFNSTIKVSTKNSLNVNTKEYLPPTGVKGEGTDKVFILKIGQSLRVRYDDSVSNSEHVKLNKEDLRVKLNNLRVGKNDTSEVINTISIVEPKTLFIKNNIIKDTFKVHIPSYLNFRIRETTLRVSQKELLTISPITHEPDISRIMIPKKNNFLRVKSFKRTELEQEEIIDSSEVIISSSTMINSGLDSFSIMLPAGKRCLIRLKEVDSAINIVSLGKVPSSLYYDEADSSIKGIPFILGDFPIEIELEDSQKIRIYIKVVPPEMIKI